MTAPRRHIAWLHNRTDIPVGANSALIQLFHIQSVSHGGILNGETAVPKIGGHGFEMTLWNWRLESFQRLLRTVTMHCNTPGFADTFDAILAGLDVPEHVSITLQIGIEDRGYWIGFEDRLERETMIDTRHTVAVVPMHIGIEHHAVGQPQSSFIDEPFADAVPFFLEASKARPMTQPERLAAGLPPDPQQPLSLGDITSADPDLKTMHLKTIKKSGGKR